MMQSETTTGIADSGGHQGLGKFLSSPLILRVPIFLLFGFDKGTRKEEGPKP